MQYTKSVLYLVLKLNLALDSLIQTHKFIDYYLNLSSLFNFLKHKDIRFLNKMRYG